MAIEVRHDVGAGVALTAAAAGGQGQTRNRLQEAELQAAENRKRLASQQTFAAGESEKARAGQIDAIGARQTAADESYEMRLNAAQERKLRDLDVAEAQARSRLDYTEPEREDLLGQIDAQRLNVKPFRQKKLPTPADRFKKNTYTDPTTGIVYPIDPATGAPGKPIYNPETAKIAKQKTDIEFSKVAVAAASKIKGKFDADIYLKVLTALRNSQVKEAPPAPVTPPPAPVTPPPAPPGQPVVPPPAAPPGGKAPDSNKSAKRSAAGRAANAASSVDPAGKPIFAASDPVVSKAEQARRDSWPESPPPAPLPAPQAASQEDFDVDAEAYRGTTGKFGNLVVEAYNLVIDGQGIGIMSDEKLDVAAKKLKAENPEAYKAITAKYGDRLAPEPSKPPTEGAKATRAIANQYIAKYGNEQGLAKAKADGWK